MSNITLTVNDLFPLRITVDDLITKEDRVVQLLASLPESYDILVNSSKLEDDKREANDNKHMANNAAESKRTENSSESDEVALMISHACSLTKKENTCHWIIDSGVTCHEVTLGDGHVVKARGAFKANKIECQRSQNACPTT